MEIPVKITYRHVRPSARIDEQIRREADELERFFPRIISCRVRVALPTVRARPGTPYNVQVDVTVPRREIVVSRHHRYDERLADARFAVEDAFHAARRMLEDHLRERRGLVKEHEVPTHGRVSKFFPEARYGFIETQDGDEIYFDERSVLDGADRIERGTEVRFVVEDAEKGPNATSVRVVGRHHHLEPTLAAGGGPRRRRDTPLRRRPRVAR